MAYAAYREALVRIAAAEMDGENVEGEIHVLARAARMTCVAIRHEINEIND